MTREELGDATCNRFGVLHVQQVLDALDDASFDLRNPTLQELAALREQALRIRTLQGKDGLEDVLCCLAPNCHACGAGR
jgi:hypothetical protein